jgi:hypothetical protein
VKNPERQFHVGQRIHINLHSGRIEDATVKAVVEHTDGLRLQVDFGHEQMALIHLWQVVEDCPRQTPPMQEKSNRQEDEPSEEPSTCYEIPWRV